MINELVREVEKCLDNGCYMAGLITALTLPDICGKVEFPNDNNTARYKKWYSKYIGKYEKCPTDKVEMPYLSADLIYSLRCSIMHEGETTIDNKKLDISYFELLWQEKESCAFTVNMSEAEIQDINGIPTAINKKYCVNIRDICYKLCDIAKWYYDKNKEKFSFNYNIVNNDFRHRQMLYNPFGLNKKEQK